MDTFGESLATTGTPSASPRVSNCMNANHEEHLRAEYCMSQEQMEQQPLPEQTLQEMGFNINTEDHWNYHQPPKPNLFTLLKDRIENCRSPTVQIRIADNNFACHMIVLQCFSQYFKKLSNGTIELPEEDVTPIAFITIYNWMVSDKLLIHQDNVLEVFMAANYLEIDRIKQHCWDLFRDDDCFREDKAFLMYLEAMKNDQTNLAELMLSRVSKYFLTIVASKDFLELMVKQVCSWLCSSTIGVHSEIEILMAAVRWLTHDWQARKTYVLDIAKCIRFYLMPCWYLVTLTKDALSPEVRKIVNHPEVRKMIADGISFVASQMHCTKFEDAFDKFQNNMPLRPSQRIWICDKQCDYHYCSMRQNMASTTTFETFQKYLQKIQSLGKEHWHMVQLANDIMDPS